MSTPDKCPRCGADESASEYSKAYACGTLVSMSGTFYHTTTCQYFSELRKPLDIERAALAARVKELEGVLQNIIDGCINPDKACRRVLLDLAPI